MKRSRLWIVLSMFVLGGCATGGAPVTQETQMDATRWRGDARLYHFLLPYPITAAERDSLAVYERQYTTSVNTRLGEAATDENAPAVVRVNALFMLAQRRADTHMHVFRHALDAEDVRVRATAVAAMREFASTHPREALGIARMGLFDPEPAVQAQALQVLGDTEVDLLREYVNRTPNADMAAVARDLVQLAEQRGAPLAMDSATGVLRRRDASGWRVRFTPRQRWEQWDAAFGSVVLERDGVASQAIDDVEAVGRVVPVFFSPDGRHVVFERGRRIVVRALATGADRVVGSGIAPRVRPFTDEFVFMREQVGSAAAEREKTRVKYDVFAMRFDPPGEVHPRLLGSTTAVLSFGENGSYSPARWMRVEERMGTFYLTSSNMEIVTLPDPFGQS